MGRQFTCYCLADDPTASDSGRFGEDFLWVLLAQKVVA